MTRKRKKLCVVASVLTLALTGAGLYAADACCPTDAAKTTGASTVAKTGAMPPGHPPVSSMGGAGGMGAMGGGSGSGAMPPGHPPVSSQSGKGGMGGMGSGGSLPPGHPPVNQQQAPQPFSGTVMVRVLQGTQDAPAPAEASIKVVFHSRQGIVQQASANLNDRGMATLDGLTFNEAVQPVVTIEHGGVTYQGIGHVMTTAQPDSVVRVTVYESQEKPVAYEVPMRHVMVQGMQGGLHVTEILAVRNGTDRSWLGAPMVVSTPAGAEDAAANTGHAAPKRSTMELALPRGASQVTLGRGFDVCCTLVETSRIVMTTALTPGTHQFQYSYVLPYQAGEVALDLTSTDTVQHLSVFVPDDGSQVTAVGLHPGQAMDNGPQRVRPFNAVQVAARTPVSVSIGLPAGAAATPEVDEAVAAKSASSMKYVVGIGAGGLLLAGLVVMARPLPTRQDSAPPPSAS